eukprot:3195816-Prymnesium_polylepis.1
MAALQRRKRAPTGDLAWERLRLGRLALLAPGSGPACSAGSTDLTSNARLAPLPPASPPPSRACRRPMTAHPRLVPPAP